MPTLTRPRWPVVSRRLIITAGAVFAAFVLLSLLVTLGAFDGLNLRLERYLQGRGSSGQDLALGLFSYLGSVELTLVIAALLGLALFRGLRFLAVLPVGVVLVATAIELLAKQLIPSVGPSQVFHRFPDVLPTLAHDVGRYSFPSGHVLRATIVYGLLLYLAERWDLFGRDSSRLSPVLTLVVIFVAYAVVYLGWHWFSDAIGGLLLGLALLIGLIAYLERKRTVNPGHQPD
jgi:membrane-associated phospholipid phosphatase